MVGEVVLVVLVVDVVKVVGVVEVIKVVTVVGCKIGMETGELGRLILK